LGMEAIQNGVSVDLANGGLYTADRENCQFVATQYDRAAQLIHWQGPGDINWSNKQTKIAYVVSGIADDDATGRSVRSLAKHHDAKRFKLQVYSTEAGVRREKQQFAQTTYTGPSTKRGAQTVDFLGKAKIATWVAPPDGDAVTAAKERANQLIKDKVDVVI